MRRNGLQAERYCRTRAANGRHLGALIWNAMRMLRRFTAADVCAVVELATLGYVKAYARRLASTGFLRAHREGHNGTPTYQMARDSGPIAPSITSRRTRVYDHNTLTEYSINDNA